MLTSCFMSAEKLHETCLSHVEIMCASCRFLATGDSYTTIAHSWCTVIGWFMNMHDASTRRKSRRVQFTTRPDAPCEKALIENNVFDLTRVDVRRCTSARGSSHQRASTRVDVRSGKAPLVVFILYFITW